MQACEICMLTSTHPIHASCYTNLQLHLKRAQGTVGYRHFEIPLTTVRPGSAHEWPLVNSAFLDHAKASSRKRAIRWKIDAFSTLTLAFPVKRTGSGDAVGSTRTRTS